MVPRMRYMVSRMPTIQTFARCNNIVKSGRRLATGVRAQANAAVPVKIAVVGAGVVGLTSALRLLQEVPTAQVTVLAEKFGTDTTTTGAAGIWGPYKLSDTPEELVHRWGASTYRHLQDLYYSPQGARAGISLVGCHWLHQDGPQPPYFWHGIVDNWTELSSRQLQLIGGGKYRHGFYHQSIVCEGRYYLAWLTKALQQLGGVLVQQRLASLHDLAPGGYDVVVDCCGLGAASLVQDPQVYPIRGQVMRVHAPWVSNAYMTDPFYIIPNRNFVVLGGTGQVGDWNTQTSLADKERIWKGCCELLPNLADAEVLEDWVGLRPGRSRLRLELESLELDSHQADVCTPPSQVDAQGGKVVQQVTDGRVATSSTAGSHGEALVRGRSGAARHIPVVHNYGHGGAGLTLAWGCAKDVVHLVQEALA